MIYAQERFDDVLAEIWPLLEEHYNEIAKYKDIPLSPDWDVYRALENINVLKIFTARDEGNLVGYAVYIVKPHLHYKTCIVANQDVLFITKDKRGQGGRFILWCDKQLKDMGVTLSVHHIKASHDFGKMLERFGYELMDLIYTRRL